MFVDEMELMVRGGRGGDGAVSFRREKYVPRGGPDGGDGGNGGNVYLYADASKHSFIDLSYRRLLKAADGGKGRGNNRHGSKGADLLVTVPPGTIVRDENRFLLADLTVPGQRALVAPGGKGGKGNARFAGSRRRAPRLAEKGLPGTERKIFLELKLIAHVGLVGLPNAGKSTLLSRISEARPKIAAYPFTTLEPNLGVVKVGDEGSFVVADLPGLIEGAHRGDGLGHRFLRHVERNLLLLFLVDLDPGIQPGPVEAYHLLIEELTAYRPKMLEVPRIVVGNKLDLTGAAARFKALSTAVAATEGVLTTVFAISAVTGEGVNELVSYLFEQVKPGLRGKTDTEGRPLEGPAAFEEGAQPKERPLLVTREDDHFRAEGSALEQVVAKTDFENPEALQRFQRYCRRSGLESLLRKQGVKTGDSVRIGAEEFTYHEEV